MNILIIIAGIVLVAAVFLLFRRRKKTLPHQITVGEASVQPIQIIHSEYVKYDWEVAFYRTTIFHNAGGCIRDDLSVRTATQAECIEALRQRFINDVIALTKQTPTAKMKGDYVVTCVQTGTQLYFTFETV